jgi:prevent-host-death family protein
LINRKADLSFLVKEIISSVAEAEERFSELVNLVYYRGESVLLTRNGRPVARLVPTDPPVVTEQEWSRRWKSEAVPAPAPAKPSGTKKLHVYRQPAVPWD